MNYSEIENGIKHLKERDGKLAVIIGRSETCSLAPKKDYYGALLRAIVGQQLSVKAAAAINRKFQAHFNGKPLPDKILSTGDTILRGLGLSNAKVKYVKDLSSKIISGEIHFRGLSGMTDEEVINEYTKVKGIGVWTVHMFLIFTLGRPNVLPVNDLGLRKAIMLNYGLRKLPDEKKVIRISKANNWTPYNSLASWYLWRSLEFND